MECPFENVEKKCMGKCNGIYMLAKELGADEDFAIDYSKYVWKRSLENKIKDKGEEPAYKATSYIKKAFGKLFTPLAKIVARDPFGIDCQISDLEKEVSEMEMNPSVPAMEYFQKVGEGYGVIFKYAAIGAKADKETRTIIEGIGKDIGTLVSMRDSIIDLREDKIEGKYNPFKKWSKNEIINFYTKEATNILERIKNKTNSFHPKEEFLVNQNALENPEIMQGLKSYAMASLNTAIVCTDNESEQSIVNCWNSLPGWGQVLVVIGGVLCCIAGGGIIWVGDGSACSDCDCNC